jgi:hypothetical protein
VFNTNQYASMVLDYVDVMLAEGNQVIDLSVLGSLRLNSVDNALDDIYGLFNGATFTLFKWMLGDLGDLKHAALKDARRRSTPAATADLNVIYSLTNFLGDSNNAAIISKAIDGSLSLGIASSFVDLSDIDVNHMIKEMLFGMAYPDTPVPAKPIPKTIDQMVQDVINGLIVGTPEEPGFAPGLTGISTLSAPPLRPIPLLRTFWPTPTMWLLCRCSTPSSKSWSARSAAWCMTTRTPTATSRTSTSSLRFSISTLSYPCMCSRRARPLCPNSITCLPN